MILKKLSNEKGYLLTESLVALSILALLILILYPIVVDWLVLVETEKQQVELTRALYETSFAWPESSKTSRYEVGETKRLLRLSDEKNTVDVHIYEIEFKK